MTIVVATFVMCVVGFAAIGIASMRRRRSTTDDYLLAGRDVSGWLTALSSAATNNSGFMFIGLLGFTYRFGVQAIWLQAGWVVGDLIAWAWVHRAVREYSGRLRATSVPRMLASAKDGTIARPIAVATGLLTFIFLGGYAAAQLEAGSAALKGIFGWPEAVGIVLGGVLVVAYCVSGGLRASIWTDAAQAMVMIVSLGALLGLASWRVGGVGALFDGLAAIDPRLVDWVPSDLAFGFGPYLLGFVCGGLGVIGQPHILVRSMAIRSSDEIARARRVYFLWYVPFSTIVVAVGLYARVLVPDLLAGVPAAGAAVAAEQTLPAVATLVLPDVLLGALLAGVFAATISTCDSQILSCSAAVTQDVLPRYRDSYLANKAATLTVATIAVTIALVSDDDVFGLVLGAWSALGATLGPLLLVRLLGLPLASGRALAMMATGLATELGWSGMGLDVHVFELLPGLLAPLLLYVAAEVVARRRILAR
jgi:sodium/proline symporter